MYDQEKKQLLEICLEMISLNMVIGSSGNASIRVDNHVVLTPSSVKYVTMSPDEMVVIDLQGELIEGDRNPSVEKHMHLGVYNAREEAKAIVHSHSLFASALAVLRKPLPPVIDEVVPILGGEIRVAEYAMPGTKDLATNVVKALDMRSGVLLANHGSLCFGKNIKDAMHNSILLERSCKIYLMALQAGQPVELPEEVVEDEADIWDMMRHY
ncbi:MAG: class II aldolase/adducin family protein [Candidatus Thorarchaeota archaeon]|nr:class II aldolase/adducin family protein [Candidatus Thorarchaeota archaeon]